tara:strand:+ start:552 stop:1142 length:591 start_codon:yes stop_codon:yes gene_type:complete
MEFNKLLKRNIENLSSINEKFIDHSDNRKNFSIVLKEIINSYKKGGRLYVAGNGGSASDSQHFVAELVCKLSKDRISIPAEALTTDTSVITSIANDYSFDQIFARQLSGKLRPHDVFLGISTSGNSPNIINAFKEAKNKKNKSILLTGSNGGESLELCDISIIVPSKITARIQEIHILFLHTLCEMIENELVFNTK